MRVHEFGIVTSAEKFLLDFFSVLSQLSGDSRALENEKNEAGNLASRMGGLKTQPMFPTAADIPFL